MTTYEGAVIGWAVVGHVSAIMIGYDLGEKRGAPLVGMLLPLLFSVFGLIVVAALPRSRDLESEATRDEIRALKLRIEALLAETREQGEAQSIIAHSVLTSAELLAKVSPRP